MWCRENATLILGGGCSNATSRELPIGANPSDGVVQRFADFSKYELADRIGIRRMAIDFGTQVLAHETIDDDVVWHFAFPLQIQIWGWQRGIIDGKLSRLEQFIGIVRGKNEACEFGKVLFSLRAEFARFLEPVVSMPIGWVTRQIHQFTGSSIEERDALPVRLGVTGMIIRLPLDFIQQALHLALHTAPQITHDRPQAGMAHGHGVGVLALSMNGADGVAQW